MELHFTYSQSTWIMSELARMVHSTGQSAPAPNEPFSNRELFDRTLEIYDYCSYFRNLPTNGQNGPSRTGSSSRLRCPTDATLGSSTYRNGLARTRAMQYERPTRIGGSFGASRRSFLENVWWIQVVFSDLREAPNEPPILVRRSCCTARVLAKPFL